MVPIVGRITSAESIFHYIDGTTYQTHARVDFRPIFLSQVLSNMTTAERTMVNDKCGGNAECIFDYAVTSELIPSVAATQSVSLTTLSLVS